MRRFVEKDLTPFHYSVREGKKNEEGRDVLFLGLLPLQRVCAGPLAWVHSVGC